jgi:hypothetical protein
MWTRVHKNVEASHQGSQIYAVVPPEENSIAETVLQTSTGWAVPDHYQLDPWQAAQTIKKLHALL